MSKSSRINCIQPKNLIMPTELLNCQLKTRHNMTTLNKVSLRIQANFGTQLATETGSRSNLEDFMLFCCEGEKYTIDLATIRADFSNEPSLVDVAKAFMRSASGRCMPVASLVAACKKFSLPKSLQLLVDEGVVSEETVVKQPMQPVAQPAQGGWISSPQAQELRDKLRAMLVGVTVAFASTTKDKSKVDGGATAIRYEKIIAEKSWSCGQYVAEMSKKISKIFDFLPEGGHVVPKMKQQLQQIIAQYPQPHQANSAQQNDSNSNSMLFEDTDNEKRIRELETWYKHQVALQETQAIEQFEQKRLDIEAKLKREYEERETKLKDEFRTAEAKYLAEIKKLQDEMLGLREIVDDAQTERAESMEDVSDEEDLVVTRRPTGKGPNPLLVSSLPRTYLLETLAPKLAASHSWSSLGLQFEEDFGFIMSESDLEACLSYGAPPRKKVTKLIEMIMDHGTITTRAFIKALCDIGLSAFARETADDLDLQQFERDRFGRLINL